MAQHGRSLLDSLGRAMGFPDFSFPDDDHCDLVFDGKVAVRLIHDPDDDHLVALAAVGTLAETAEASEVEALLAANLFWSGASGATLALDQDDNVVLQRRWPLDGMSLGRLETELSGFLDRCEEWTARLSVSAPPAAQAAQVAPPPADGIRV